MALLDFGQPGNGIIQMAYVVPDVRAAMAQWTQKLRAGPWFLIDHFKGEEALYRGKPSRADSMIAMGFAGHMQIELIQPNDNEPSVYREVIESRGYGFHHFGVACANFQAEVVRFQAQGYELAFHARALPDARVAYLDMKGELPGMLELIEAGPGISTERFFTRVYQASVGWDGSNPVRSFDS